MRRLGELLEAVATQECQPQEVVVVDDGSTDGTAHIVNEWSRRDPSVRLIAGPRRGIAAALNAGVSALSTDVIVRFDGHCHSSGDYIFRAACGAALASENGSSVNPQAPAYVAYRRNVMSLTKPHSARRSFTLPASR